MGKKHYVYVKRIDSRKVVHSVEVPDKNLTPGNIDKVAAGLLRQVNRDHFFVDDDEAAREALKRSTKRRRGDTA